MSPNDTIVTIRCTKCGEEKPATDQFFSFRESRNNFDSWCRSCLSRQNIEYLKSHPEKRRERIQNWRAKNPERNRENGNRWRRNNLKKARRSSQNDYRKNREKRKDKNKRWRKTHRENMRFYEKAYVARKRGLADNFKARHWQQALEYFHGCCAYCQRPPSWFDVTQTLHQDHFIPVSQNGPYTPKNIVPACEQCNLSKNAHDPIEWLNEHFGAKKAKIILKRIQDYFDCR